MGGGHGASLASVYFPDACRPTQGTWLRPFPHRRGGHPCPRLAGMPCVVSIVPCRDPPLLVLEAQCGSDSGNGSAVLGIQQGVFLFSSVHVMSDDKPSEPCQSLAASLFVALYFVP